MSQSCSVFLYADDHKTKGSGLAPWPARLTSSPPRLADFGYSTDMFEKDTVLNSQSFCNHRSYFIGFFHGLIEKAH